MHQGRMHFGVAATLLSVAFILVLSSPAVAGVEQMLMFQATGTGAIPDTTSGCGDNSPAGAPLVMSFNVAGLTQDLGKVALDMNIDHTWMGDLTVVLQAPAGPGDDPGEGGGGPFSYVFSRVGATTPTSCANASTLGAGYGFDDDINNEDLWEVADGAGLGVVLPSTRFGASGPDPGSFPLGAGIPMLEERFTNAFNGLPPGQVNGIWTLTVVDNSGGDTGAVNSASLYLWGSSIFDDGFESGNTTAWSSTSP